MKTEVLTERNFQISDPLVSRVFGQPLPQDPKSYASIVYFDESHPKVVAGKLVYHSETSVEPSKLERLFQFQRFYNFNECLIISTLYYSYPVDFIERIIATSLESIDGTLEEILSSTNGYLLYSYQFELAAQLILGIDPDTSINLRKYFNRRKDISKCGFDFDRMNYFLEVLDHVLITNVVYRPYYEGAKNLHFYVRSFQ